MEKQTIINRSAVQNPSRSTTEVVRSEERQKRRTTILYVFAAAIIVAASFYIETSLVNLHGYLCFAALLGAAVLLSSRIK